MSDLTVAVHSFDEPPTYLLSDPQYLVGFRQSQTSSSVSWAKRSSCANTAGCSSRKASATPLPRLRSTKILSGEASEEPRLRSDGRFDLRHLDTEVPG